MCSMWNASRSRNGWVDNLLHIFSRVVTRRLGGIPDHVQDLFHLILPLSPLSLSLSCAEDDIKSLKYHFKKCFSFGKQNAKYHHHCHSHHHCLAQNKSYLAKSLLKCSGNRRGFMQKVVGELQAHPVIISCEESVK